MLVGLSFSFLMQGCPAPTRPKIPTKSLPSTQRELRVIMQQANEHFVQAGPIASETSNFMTEAAQVAEAMRTTRERYSPDPIFYQLADEAFRYASESTTANEPALRALAWSNTQQACQQCHLRYGGPRE